MIKQQAIKSVKWSAIAVVAGNCIQFIQLIIVANYISAADYGLMAISLVITYFAQMLGDMGVSNAMIYMPDVSKITFSSVFWMSLLFSWIVFGILIVSAPLIASYCKQPGLIQVVRFTAVIFLFLPAQLLYLSLLRKELAFDKIAWAEIISKIIALLVAVYFALHAAGVFALVYGTLAGVAMSTILYIYWGIKYQRIGFVFRPGLLRKFIHFGIFQTGNDILSYIIFHADTIILGRLLGINAVGYYTFAKNLAIRPTQIINPVITQVAFPLLAKTGANNEVTKSIYLKMLSFLSVLNFVVYPFLAACATIVIKFFFGDQWLPAAKILQGLSLFCMLRSVYNPLGALLSSKGMVDRLFYWNLVMICILPTVIYFTASLGSFWISIALAVSFSILFIPMWRYLVWPACNATLKELWQCMQQPLLISFGLFAILSLFNLFSYTNNNVHFFVSLLIWMISAFLLTFFLNKKVYEELVEISGQVFNKKV